MAVTLYDATIQGSQLITVGTTVMISADFYEVNSQTYSISSGTATLFDSAGAAVTPPSPNQSAFTDMTAVIGTGIRSAKRASVTLNASYTTSVSAGQYYLIWSLALGDGQTRKVKQSIQVRSVT
jgi:hypothetical protein